MKEDISAAYSVFIRGHLSSADTAEWAFCSSQALCNISAAVYQSTLTSIVVFFQM